MNQMEQGIELTLKVLMKVKDDEIAALCDEINHRDTEAENLKKEIFFWLLGKAKGAKGWLWELPCYQGSGCSRDQRIHSTLFFLLS